MNSHKLYVLVDKTLTQSQQAVQACHAVAEFAKAHPEWEHQSLVLLGVNGEQQMEEWQDFLGHERQVKMTHFRESYWNDRLTALACYGCDQFVRNLPLL